MSRVYFHSPSGEAELRGSERAYLDFVSRGPAMQAYDFQSSYQLDKIERLLQLVEPTHELHALWRAAKAEDDAHKASWKDLPPGTWSSRPFNSGPMDHLKTRMEHAFEGRFGDLTLHLDDITLHVADIAMNTALVAGSDPIKFAAKLHGYCEIHAWVDGPNRDWVASIIDEGLETGIYRGKLNYQNNAGVFEEHSQGWEDVQTLLRSRNDEPVVMSYSVCDQFPNQDVADWTPEPSPQDWKPDWANDSQGLKEWEEYGDKDGLKEEAQRDRWYDLPDNEKWEYAMAGLKKKPWLEITPESLGGTFFESPISAYDLLRNDRDEQIRAKAGKAG